MVSFVKFIEGMNHINNDKTIFFDKINNWGSFTEEEYKRKKIWDESHPEFPDFLEELKKVLDCQKTSDVHIICTDINPIIDKYKL